jgi:hypothetical protein
MIAELVIISIMLNYIGYYLFHMYEVKKPFNLILLIPPFGFCAGLLAFSIVCLVIALFLTPIPYVIMAFYKAIEAIADKEEL